MTDPIERQAAIDAVWNCSELQPKNKLIEKVDAIKSIIMVPSAQPEIVRCKDCKWWEKQEDSPLGYCNAVKHCHYSRHWEIQIYRRYEPDFFCADGERRSEDDTRAFGED